MNAEYINAMSNADFADQIMLPELLKAGLIKEGFEADAAWLGALAEIVRPRTKMPADAATVAAPVFATAETLAYDEKSVSKGLAKEGMGAVLDAAKAALEALDEWTPANIDAALEPLPEVLDVKKRLVFGAVRVAECGNMVSPRSARPWRSSDVTTASPVSTARARWRSSPSTCPEPTYLASALSFTLLRNRFEARYVGFLRLPTRSHRTGAIAPVQLAPTIRYTYFIVA